VIRKELLEIADGVTAAMGAGGQAARQEILHAAGRVAGAISEIQRGAGR
jgi:hypothetical protein